MCVDNCVIHIELLKQMRVALTPALSSASCLFVLRFHSALCPLRLLHMGVGALGAGSSCFWSTHRGGLLGLHSRPPPLPHTYTLSVLRLEATLACRSFIV